MKTIHFNTSDVALQSASRVSTSLRPPSSALVRADLEWPGKILPRVHGSAYRVHGFRPPRVPWTECVRDGHQVGDNGHLYLEHRFTPDLPTKRIRLDETGRTVPAFVAFIELAPTCRQAYRVVSDRH